MKSNYFSSGSAPSQIRVKREKPRKKQVNWDRTVYLLVLILVVTLITRHLLSRTYFVSGEGQVISEVVDIRSPDDIDIRMIRVKPGDFVEPGDTLFSFSFIDWQERQAEIDRVNQRIADLRFELADARERVFLKREEIRTLENRIAFLEREKEVFQERVRLNISTVFELNAINRDLFDAQSKLEMAVSEERVLGNLITRMDERLDVFVNNYFIVAQNIETRYFTSQIGGRVDNIFKKGNSQAFRSEEILTLIPDQSEVFVLSVFNRKDTRYLNTGSVMNIEFDNGDRSQGIVMQSYEARDDLLRHFRQTGTITSDYLIVELEPYDVATKDFWRTRHRSGLQITKPRYFNFLDIISSGFGTAVANIPAENEIYGLEPQTEAIQVVKSESARDKTDCKNTLINTEIWSTPEENGKIKDVTESENSPDSASSVRNQPKPIAGYSVNLHSFSDRDRARLEAQRVSEIEMFVCEHQTESGSVVWRVSAGEFETIAEARGKAEKLVTSTAQGYFITRLSDTLCRRE